METATRNYPPGGLRVSDADRDRAVSELSEAFQACGSRPRSSSSDPRRPCAPAPEKLTALFADLPLDRAPAVRTGDLERARVLATWIVMAASAAAAIPLAAVALLNALSTGPSLAQREAQRELAQQVLARQGISLGPAPPRPGLRLGGHDNTSGNSRTACRADRRPPRNPYQPRLARTARSGIPAARGAPHLRHDRARHAPPCPTQNRYTLQRPRQPAADQEVQRGPRSGRWWPSSSRAGYRRTLEAA